ncbi:VanZ family protein [Heliophilum fasciatum]|uniref:VanZ family protein n=1 Tax=Heliophilum fasciatum TaxID=35700 RepID=A0A4R2RJY3_9FIRM|nr:VanZ family protein [Heliophilum fasciatum]MCW2278112.1 VanZ family protein [Heliophilum fasciatum]TCP64182.1 VanZ family protein [Heliophilum fasciatum]
MRHQPYKNQADSEEFYEEVYEEIYDHRRRHRASHRGVLWLGWGMVIFWCAIIFIVTASPEGTPEATRLWLAQTFGIDGSLAYSLNWSFRKLTHLLLFGGLAVLIYFLLRQVKVSGGVAFIVAWLITTIYGAINEWCQLYVPGQDPLVADVILVALGALTVLLTMVFGLQAYCWIKERNSL